MDSQSLIHGSIINVKENNNFSRSELFGHGLKCNPMKKALRTKDKSNKSRSGVVVRSILTSDIFRETMFFEETIFKHQKADPKNVASIILGGGAGTRLFPLTSHRAKPAVPIGGCYRLIDIPMSNCINSGIDKIFIMTQFNSASLNRHLARTYNFGNGINFGDGFVEVLYSFKLMPSSSQPNVSRYI